MVALIFHLFVTTNLKSLVQWRVELNNQSDSVEPFSRKIILKVAVSAKQGFFFEFKGAVVFSPMYGLVW